MCMIVFSIPNSEAQPELYLTSCLSHFAYTVGHVLQSAVLAPLEVKLLAKTFFVEFLGEHGTVPSPESRPTLPHAVNLISLHRYIPDSRHS